MYCNVVLQCLCRALVKSGSADVVSELGLGLALWLGLGLVMGLGLVTELGGGLN